MLDKPPEAYDAGVIATAIKRCVEALNVLTAQAHTAELIVRFDIKSYPLSNPTLKVQVLTEVG